MGNQFKTALLLAVMTVFIMLIGRLLGGQLGMLIALVLAAGMNFFSYWYSDRIVLKMYRAREATPQEHAGLYTIVQGLTRKAGLPMPKVYIIPEEAPNAFATGRNPEHAVVAVTEGLLRIMNPEEITGVLAHELAHIKNRDILIGSIAATMAGAVMLLASMARWAAIFGVAGNNDQNGSGRGMLGLIMMSILAPVAAMLIQMAISRSREYLADTTGAGYAESPKGLAKALEKLGAYAGRRTLQANPATAHMFIVNPLSGEGFRRLFTTHPPIEDRVARLMGNRQAKAAASGAQADQGKARAKAHWDRLSG